MYIMPVRAIKGIIEREINAHADNLRQSAYCDPQREMISMSKSAMLDRLAKCQTHEDLEDFLGFAGYRMSLIEWIESL